MWQNSGVGITIHWSTRKIPSCFEGNDSIIFLQTKTQKSAVDNLGKGVAGWTWGSCDAMALFLGAMDLISLKFEGTGLEEWLQPISEKFRVSISGNERLGLLQRLTSKQTPLLFIRGFGANEYDRIGNLELVGLKWFHWTWIYPTRMAVDVPLTQ